MRTTVEISDSLFVKVKRTMQKRRTTLRAPVEEGLTHVPGAGVQGALRGHGEGAELPVGEEVATSSRGRRAPRGIIAQARGA